MDKVYDNEKEYKDAEKRVKKAERSFNRAKAAGERLRRAMENYSRTLGELFELSAYYSGDWKRDYEADENGEFPTELKRGVLSEDGLWDFFSEARELAGDMRELADATEAVLRAK